MCASARQSISNNTAVAVLQGLSSLKTGEKRRNGPTNRLSLNLQQACKRNERLWQHIRSEKKLDTIAVLICSVEPFYLLAFNSSVISSTWFHDWKNALKFFFFEILFADNNAVAFFKLFFLKYCYPILLIEILVIQRKTFKKSQNVVPE